MASFATLAESHNGTLAVPLLSHECAHCRSVIVSGERWVREKIQEPVAAPACETRYRRYHADLFDGEELSCWERHQMEQEISKTGERVS